MAYVCEVLETVNNVQTCVQWAVYSPFLPELTTEARDELLKWALGIFIGLFVFNKVIYLIKRP